MVSVMLHFLIKEKADVPFTCINANGNGSKVQRFLVNCITIRSECNTISSTKFLENSFILEPFVVSS